MYILLNTVSDFKFLFLFLKFMYKMHKFDEKLKVAFI